uniref:PtrMTP6 n=1 Tax=Arundo donax TaxID=35708 RepID=A0A0A9DQ80_ARUDO
MILKAGIQTGYESVLELIDAVVDPSLLEPIRETILKVDGVKGCHRLRGRKAGTSLYLDVHIEVYPFLSVSAAHDIGETVRHQIQKAHSQVAEVFIHIDPSYSVGPNIDLKRTLTNYDRRNSEAIPRQHSAEAIVSDIISSHFSKKMSLEHLMLHYVQGRVLLQVQVSMSPEILIQDAMDIAKQAEEEILRADASISQVSVQLRLGQQIKQLQMASSKNSFSSLHAGEQ